MLLNNKHRVFVDFPKVGLGNMMLVWARAVVFCKINNLEFTTSSWWGFRWGALLRRETKKRLYYNYFIESSWKSRAIFRLNKMLNTPTYNPELNKITNKSNPIFIFNKVNLQDDLFDGIRNYRDEIKSKLEATLHERIKTIISNETISDISIHVRRGDFKKGNTITPISHFINGIKLVREIAKKELSVTVFTDATNEEIEPLYQLGNIKLAKENPDIADIILMSKSKIIFLSQSSSFSYWAAFLSDSLIIMHANDWQKKICDENKNSSYKEYRWDEKNNLPSELIINALN